MSSNLPRSSLGHRFKFHSICEPLHTSAFEPLDEVLALTDVEVFKSMASINYSLDANTGDTNAASD